MKELFMRILSNLSTSHDNKITSANMYEDGNYSSLRIENEDGKFSISITKLEDKNNVN